VKISSTAVALSVFLAINIAIPVSLCLKKDKGAGDTIQRALMGASERLQISAGKAKPVVLIGSSLIIAPLWSADVKHGFFHQDCMNHHESKQLKNILSAAGMSADVVSLATAGQFVSDTYLIVDKLLTEETKPEVLVYGIAPRDFMDDTAGGMALTSVFDQLVTFSDMPTVSQLFFNTYEERIDFMLNRTNYIYRKRGRYQTKFQESCEKLAAGLMRDKKAQIATIAGANDPLAGFLVGGNRTEIWTKSIEEYRQRYKSFNEQQFNKQKLCFKALVDLCQKRQIKLCVVAMPLTEDNRKLMPGSMYDQYISFVETTSKQSSVPFIDLDKSGAYQNADFYDTVHLNGDGGDRFISTVGNLVTRESSSSLAGSKPAVKAY